MDDALLVRGDEAREHLREDVDDVLEGQATFGGDAIGERLADELLHDQVRAPVLERAEVVDLADVRVANGPCGARLLVEASNRVLLPRLVGVQHLDGDRAADGQVLRLEDRAHAALAEHAADDVLAADRLAEQIARRALRRPGGRLVARRCDAGRWLGGAGLVVLLAADRLAGGRAEHLQHVVRHAAVGASDEALAHAPALAREAERGTVASRVGVRQRGGNERWGKRRLPRRVPGQARTVPGQGVGARVTAEHRRSRLRAAGMVAADAAARWWSGR